MSEKLPDTPASSNASNSTEGSADHGTLAPDRAPPCRAAASRTRPDAARASAPKVADRGSTPEVDVSAAGQPAAEPFTEQSNVMRRLARQVRHAAPTRAPVLIIGESGTGKEVIARRLHAQSHRASRPFVPVNCGAIPPTLIEAELFGHEKGSFTGAIARNQGYFECASGGTLFLDEITEMAPAMQVKLLRVLEVGDFHRVGGNEKIEVDVRIIAATNREPAQAVRDGKFREDLMYRLAVFPLRVPPLRERREDIPLLARLFVDELNRHAGTNRRLSPQALETLSAWHWPGNVRELKNAVHRAFILAGDTIEIGPLQPPSKGMKRGFDGCLKVPLGTSLASVHRELILSTLAHCKGDKRRAAETLGVSLKTLYNRMDLYAASNR